MDLIVTGLNATGSQVKAVIKGGRKPGSRRGAHLELFSKTNVLLYQGRSELMTVSEAELVKAHNGCRSDLEHSSAAAAVTELVEVLSRDSDSEPRLFLLLDASLDAIGSTAIDGLEMIVAASLLKIVGQVGFLPNLESCSICGRPRFRQQVGAEREGFFDGGVSDDDDSDGKSMMFSFEEGGVVCSRCSVFRDRSDDDEWVHDGIVASLGQVDPAILDWLVLLIRSRFDELEPHAVAVNRHIGRLLLIFARDWMRAQVTAQNRSVDFLLNMN